MTALRDLADSLVFIPQDGPQTEAYFSKADVLLYGGAAGGGKGLVHGTPVVTPYGPRNIESLKVGDKLCAVDGGNTQVIGVYPQPEQPVYRVSFADGGHLDTDGPHRWLYSVAGKGKWRKSGHAWKVGTTEQLADMMTRGRTLLIPLPKPLQFTRSYRFNMRVLDPYLLGVLLGDGCLRNGVKISTADPEILDWCGLSPDDYSSYGYDHRLKGDALVHIAKECDRLGIGGKLAVDKFIPESYLWGSVTDRWALLQGLMDTDGTASADNKAGVYFTSVSFDLASGVQFLVRSLGGYATITSKQPTVSGSAHRENGELYHTAYTVYIRLPDASLAFRLPRKRNRCQPSQGAKRRIVSIEPMGRAKTTCIAVDHPTSLFIAGNDIVVTHNTALACGLSVQEHQEILFVRREAKQLDGVTDELERMLGTRDGLRSSGGSPSMWRLPSLMGEDSGKIIFGSCPNLGDENRYQGRPRDLLVVDEAANMLEQQVHFLKGWVRSADPRQRCRTLLCSNPPTSSDGEWLIKWFAPWLDEYYPNPAAPGELRWFAVIDGEHVEVENGDPFDHNGEMTYPESRTFIPAKVQDNKYLMDTNYIRTLQAMPEPLRSQMLYGDFTAGKEDDEWQVIPSDWVRIAQQRWTEKDHEQTDITSAGVDPSRGGRDSTIYAARVGWWYDTLKELVGEETDRGGKVSSKVTAWCGLSMCPVHVDVIGIGASVIDHLEAEIGSRAVSVNAAAGVDKKDETGKLTFLNQRAFDWWRMRTLLNPAKGIPIALPPDNELKAELCAPRYKLSKGGIQIEAKQDIIKRLGRSTDRADAVILASKATPIINDARPTANITVRGSMDRRVT